MDNKDKELLFKTIKDIFEQIRILTEAAGIQSISIVIIEGSAIIMPTVYNHQEAIYILEALIQELRSPITLSGKFIDANGKAIFSPNKLDE